MVPAWKIKRECARVGKQIAKLYHSCFGVQRRQYYDHVLRKQIRLTEGAQPLQRDVAILLIYQPKRLLDSLLMELEHFAEKGVSVMVVSNAPLTEAQRTTLAAKAWLVMERPNFGYDFGGYRDGVLELMARDIAPDNLFVLNDSIWFPIRRDCTLLDRARASKADIFGIFYNPKSRNEHHWHLHSYFYRFGGKMVASEAFRTYWRTIPLYNDKDVVIRNFELKLTGQFLKKGFTVEPLYTPEDMVSAVLSLDDATLYQALEFFAEGSKKGTTIFAPVFEAHETGRPWRPQAETLIRESRYKYYFLDQWPLIYLGIMKSPIIKKHKEINFRRQRRDIFAQGYGEMLDPVVAHEVRSWNDWTKPE